MKYIGAVSMDIFPVKQSNTGVMTKWKVFPINVIL